MKHSAQIGRSGNLKRRRWRRPLTMASNDADAGDAASTQLQIGPIEPDGPLPPISLKVLSIGATVSPRMTHQAAPLIGDEAAERDDEGRDLRIGDEHAVEAADRRAERDAEEQRR